MNYYKRDGTPYPEGEQGLMEWSEDFENFDKKIVKQETLPNGKWVSTVWLGLDHSFLGGDPLIFETMVFESKGGDDVDMERYSTEEEALEGHKRMVEKYSK